MAIVKSYKGFNLDMTCHGFQYEEGGHYETDSVRVCRSGYHACEHPNDVLGYYAPSRSVYHRVVQSGKIDRSISGNDSKLASSEITIKERISINEMAKAAMHMAEANHREMSALDCKTISSDRDSTYVYSGGLRSVASTNAPKSASHICASMSASISTGNCSVAYSKYAYDISGSTGDWSISCADGEVGIACTTGYESATEEYGSYGISCSTGNGCLSSSTGEHSAAITTGRYSCASTVGEWSVAVAVSGCSCTFAGKAGSLAVAWGERSCAKGVKGALLFLTEWVDYLKTPKYKVVYVDGEIIKEDTAYALIDGVVKEVNLWEVNK